ncbi:hypothetical protein BGZ73_001453 [Actinomortierella ambigua]|nr:hypothetical protein BGZ73_001453 [Actinomortierella ambigua]
MANNLFTTSPLAALGGAGAIRLDTVDHDPLTQPLSSNGSSPPSSHPHAHAQYIQSTPSPVLSPPLSSELPERQRRRRRQPPGRRQSLPSYESDSYPARFIRSVVSVLERIKQRLPERYQPYFYVGLWFGFAVTILALAIGYRSKLFQLLESFASFIKGLGLAGPPIIVGALFLVSFPPLIGYSSLVSLSGYVFGFWQGFLVAYSGALLGSVVCFVLCRKWYKAHVRKLLAKNQSMKSVIRAVEKRGFKMLLLIRLAPYPFNLMNALFSATHIPFFTYFAGTAVSLVKLALHVYIGSTLSSLIGTPTTPPPSDGGDDTPPPPAEDGSRALKIVVMVFSMILAIVVGAYVWNIALKEIEEMEQSRVERRRKKRESLARHQQRRPSATDRSGGGGGGVRGQEHSAAMALARSTSSNTISSPDGSSSRHHSLQGLHTMMSGANGHRALREVDGETVSEIDLTHAADASRFSLEPEEYFVGGARASSDDEDDHDDAGGDGSNEHAALVAGDRDAKSRSNRVGQGYYGDQFNEDEDFVVGDDDDDDDDYDSEEDSDFSGEPDGYDDVTDEEEQDQDLDDMERGQDDVLDLSAAFEPTYAERLHNDTGGFHEDEHAEWFSQRVGDANDRW